MERNVLVRKRSQGGMLIFELTNDIREKMVISLNEIDLIYHCVDIYDIYLEKHSNETIGKLERISKNRIKRLLRSVRNINCDVNKKRKALSDVMYILTNLESVKKWGS